MAFEYDPVQATFTLDATLRGTAVHNLIQGFYPGESKTILITLKIGGVAQDLTTDTITLRMKTNQDDTDANAVLAKAGSGSALGVVTFSLVPADTKDITPGRYYTDIEWLDGTDEYVVYGGIVEVYARSSDTP